jgi:hypothetical protein
VVVSPGAAEAHAQVQMQAPAPAAAAPAPPPAYAPAPAPAYAPEPAAPPPSYSAPPAQSAAPFAWADSVQPAFAREAPTPRGGGSGAVVAVVLVIACLAAGGVYFGREPLQRYLNPPRNVESPTDGLVVTSVYPRMVPRADGAPRLVVEGTLANYGANSRAHVKVNALVLEGDQVVASRQAYCGTQFDDRKLARITTAEIDAAYPADGTDGSNRSIPQGGRVNFMVVFTTAQSGAPLSFDPGRHRLRVEVASADPTAAAPR